MTDFLEMEGFVTLLDVTLDWAVFPDLTGWLIALLLMDVLTVALLLTALALSAFFKPVRLCVVLMAITLLFGRPSSESSLLSNFLLRTGPLGDKSESVCNKLRSGDITSVMRVSVRLRCG